MIKKLYLTPLILGGFLSIAQPAYAQEIETIEVTASTSMAVISDPITDISLLESLMPEVTVAGGFGGFSGFVERGTQPIHTTVYRNGVPVNDAGAGWYDFGHDLATGNETIKIINGPNSVLYGSGSLGGTIFMNDILNPGSTIRYGTDHYFVSHSLENFMNITYLDVSNGSVRSDNTEDDHYKNLTARFQTQVGDYTTTLSITDYDYDFDQCWNNMGIFTNSCKQEGQKATLSVRNDKLTLGYTFNNADYFANQDKTWESEAKRWYGDYRDSYKLSNLGSGVLGVTFDQESYAGEKRNNVAVYGTFKTTFDAELGVRVSEDAVVYRLGYERGDFFANVGTSYRNPSLYQIAGDAWTMANPNLNPEKAFGIEYGYGPLSFFRYQFDEGIDYDYTNNQYINTSNYKTQGVRFLDKWVIVPNGWVGLDIGYTESDQPRIAKYKAVVGGGYSFDQFTARLTYTGMFDRKPGPYDGDSLPDINSFDLSIQRHIAKNYLLSLTARDILDRQFEVVPGYNAGGRQILLTIQFQPE